MIESAMAVRADIMEVARVLEEAARARDLARFKPPAPIGADAAVYAKLMRALPRQNDVPGRLQEARLRPYYLQNGLIVAAAMPRPARAVLLEALAAGLLEFVDHFERLAEAGGGRAEALADDAAARQERYFAYVAAQLVEFGLPLTGALATMKGDCLDEPRARELKRWIEEGPSAMLASPRLSPRERELWDAVFQRGREAWPALRDHLVGLHGLPFRPLPAR